MTPSTTTDPYCTAAQMLRAVDWRVIGDLVGTLLTHAAGPRPTRRSLTDDTREAGEILADHLLAASGELETACAAGGRYGPTDLAALTDATAGGKYLRALVARLAHWSLAQAAQPAAADPDRVPGAAAALAVLEQLRQGERILPFEEAGSAGGAATASANHDTTTEPGGSRLAARNNRLFDTRESY